MPAATAAPPELAYIYVDTAIGGEDHRNNILRVDRIPAPNGVADCYATYLRGTEYLVHWVANHRNAKGNPTITDFDGYVWSPVLPFDVDGENLEETLDRTRAVLRKLEALGVDLQPIR